MIRIEHLTKSFKNENSRLVALNNVSAQIEDGELLGIIGSSGAGKSTLIRHLSLIEKPDSGTIWLDDIDLFKLKGKDLIRMRRQLGIVFQGYHLLEQKNVFGRIDRKSPGVYGTAVRRSEAACRYCTGFGQFTLLAFMR